MPDCAPVTKTMSQDSARTTAVLIAVARFEFTTSIPIFARIEVNAANTEDKIAKINHIIFIKKKRLLFASNLFYGFFLFY